MIKTSKIILATALFLFPAFAYAADISPPSTKDEVTSTAQVDEGKKAADDIQKEADEARAKAIDLQKKANVEREKSIAEAQKAADDAQKTADEARAKVEAGKKLGMKHGHKY